MRFTRLAAMVYWSAAKPIKGFTKRKEQVKDERKHKMVDW